MATQFENGLTLSGLAERNAELVTEVEKLRAERDASLNAERVWEKTMMEVCGEDGPASVAEVIKALAAENVALKLKGRELLNEASKVYQKYNATIDFYSGDFMDGQTLHEFQFVLDAETPATDRIVAEAEARGVEKFIASLPSYADTEVNTYDDGAKAAIETTQTVYGPVFIKQLREGAK
ncbi:TPA: hypothetical protein OT206_001909 [Klebsiella variicola]|nr:hypothetical protein [Klebsiella variicola]